MRPGTSPGPGTPPGGTACRCLPATGAAPRGYGGALSPREQQVAELAADGRSNKEIAAELFLSPDTVKKHLQAAMRKLDVRARAGLSRRLPDLSAGAADHHPGR